MSEIEDQQTLNQLNRIKALRRAVQKAAQSANAVQLDFPRQACADELDLLAGDIEALLKWEKPRKISTAEAILQSGELVHILMNFPVEMVIFDLEFRYVFANRLAVRNDEVREWLIGKTDHEYCAYRNVDPKLARERWDLFNEIKSKPRTVSMNQENVQSDGSVRHYIRSLSPILDANGELAYLVGYGFDVSESRKQEYLLKVKNDALEKSNAELDHFVYRSSHDLRAPLLSVMGLIDLLRAEGVGESQEMYLDMIHTSMVKLDQFIREIVEYSKNSRVDIELEAINFNAIVQESIEGVKYLKGHQDVDFYLDIQAEVPFFSDQFRVKTVVSNLISNAVKYQDPKKEKSEVEVKITVNETHADLSFRDNGVGIAKEFHAQLFDMFFRASHTAFGSGLGLYIVKEMIMKIEGEIEVESALREGTCFKVKLKNYPRPGESK